MDGAVRLGAPSIHGTSGMKKWRCLVCDYIYDEAKGWPEEGIAAGTLWADVPAGWSCPDCGASKADFELIDS